MVSRKTKAFDRVHWGFFFKVLERVGLGKVFVGWLRALYTGVESTVSVNGHMGDFFQLHSGVRQGCPLSPLLYVLYMEPLAAAIRADAGVKGLLVPGSGGLRVKVTQYADDTTLLLDNDSCLMRSLEIFQDFGRVSGAELNLAKTSVKFYGRWKNRTDVPAGLTLCDGPLRILGVHFASAQSAVINWTSRIGKIRRKLGLWQSRKLTFVGKVLVLKVDVMPSLVYLSYIFPLPAFMRRSLMRIVFSFLWGGRHEYVSRARMIASTEEGGRDVPHFPLKLDCFFVSFLLRELSSPSSHPSFHFLMFYFAYPARPLISWSNTGPRAEKLPWHFAHAKKWLRAHPVALDRALGPRPSELYRRVREEVTAQPVVDVPAAVWVGVQLPGLDNGLKDLNWLVLHRSLPVRDIMYRHGLTASPKCPRASCFGVETMRHALWDCPFAAVTWARAATVLARVDRGFALSWDTVERGVDNYKASERDKFLLVLIISLYKKSLWEARQALVYRGKDWGVAGACRTAEQDLKERVRRDVVRWGMHTAKERWKGGLGLCALF